MSKYNSYSTGSIAYTICALSMVALFMGFVLSQSGLSDSAVASLQRQERLVN